VIAAIRLEPRAEDGAVPGEFPLVGRLLEEHLEAVARLKVAVEVNLAAEDFGDRHRELDRFAGPVHGRDE
jgi:hypothetical protein